MVEARRLRRAPSCAGKAQLRISPASGPPHPRERPLTRRPQSMPTPSAQQGMGALPYAGGVGFRVWAPFASSVAVAGAFNGWSATANPLVPEGSSGNWSGDVPGATVGQQYKYVI